MQDEVRDRSLRTALNRIVAIVRDAVKSIASTEAVSFYTVGSDAGIRRLREATTQSSQREPGSLDSGGSTHAHFTDEVFRVMEELFGSLDPAVGTAWRTMLACAPRFC